MRKPENEDHSAVCVSSKIKMKDYVTISKRKVRFKYFVIIIKTPVRPKRSNSSGRRFTLPTEVIISMELTNVENVNNYFYVLENVPLCDTRLVVVIHVKTPLGSVHHEAVI